ncbi:MAG: SRPBCC domain-containing protein [Proteobacteria bacterium]|nr:SRPBCC domain-containing protein [Pseudomonadota bacterium]
MKHILIALLALTVPAAAADLRDTSFREANGSRVQQLELTVKATPAQIWAAFTTDEGFTGWGAAVAHVTLANDGMIEASYSPDAKIGDPDDIRNRIVAYVPDRLLVLHNAHVPSKGPFKQAVIDKIRTVIVIDDLGDGRCRITESGVGYGEGADFDSMYEHFRAGNAEVFAALADYLGGKRANWAVDAKTMTDSVGQKP